MIRFILLCMIFISFPFIRIAEDIFRGLPYDVQTWINGTSGKGTGILWVMVFAFLMSITAIGLTVGFFVFMVQHGFTS